MTQKIFLIFVLLYSSQVISARKMVSLPVPVYISDEPLCCNDSDFNPAHTSNKWFNSKIYLQINTEEDRGSLTAFFNLSYKTANTSSFATNNGRPF